MPCYLGIDTSNYTTSAAVYDRDTRQLWQSKRLLSVPSGRLGLKQSDAVFLHVKQLAEMVGQVMEQAGRPVLDGVAASAFPTDRKGSYMPCFLVGTMAAQTTAAAMGVPCALFSHQAGHVVAALYSADKLDLLDTPFLAFHFSGGTTECLLVEPDEGEARPRIQTVSKSLDLNAGQAVDRVGALLGLPFPAGPMLEELARQSERSFAPKVTFRERDCCLSGLENQCANLLGKGEFFEDVAKYCLDYLAAVVLEMTRIALEVYPGLPLVYAGGVMSNTMIREAVQRVYPAHFALPEYSSDNAAGIAILCARGGREVPQCSP